MGTAVTVVACALIGCTARPVLDQDAYVWQRNWSEPVREAVASAPTELGGLRVLVAEAAGDRLALIPVQLADVHRPITLVIRVDGARPITELSLAPIVAAAHAWQARGVTIAGLEVDHDCATARLPEYTAWLASQRVPGLRLSITALPTWADSPALADLAATVDELVVQVHAVRAPQIFEPVSARRGLVAFADAVPAAHLRVALPTYRALIHGQRIEVDPDVVAAFIAELPRSISGIVWFRLPVAGDDDTWSADTFAAVLAKRPRPPAAIVALEDRGDGRYDLIASNPSAHAAELPAVRLDGDILAAELVGGYEARGNFHWVAHGRLAPGASQAIGWARGKALHVATD